MTIENDDIPRSKADVGWKLVLEEFFEEAIAFSFPKLYSEIDWSKPWEFLDKELNAIAIDSTEGSRFVDKLIRVHMKTGEEKWLMLHIEVQGDFDPGFERRMFIYHYRIFDKFGKHPISCAFLTDPSQTWRPNKYEHQSFSISKITFEFTTLKLIDFEKKRDMLENSSNPFACVILAQLDFLKAKNDINEKYRIKIELTKRLYKKGFNKDTIRGLFYFVDALIRLPNNLEIRFSDEIFKYENEVNHMNYISTIEQRGIQTGMHQERIKIALRMLEKGYPINLITYITKLTKDEITPLYKEAMLVP